MAAKKIVKFSHTITTPEVGRRCSLGGVENHYRLGDCDWVNTSYVVEVRDGGKTIETKNTIYQMVED